MKNTLIKWLFETKKKKPPEDDLKREEERIKKERKDEDKKKATLLNMQNLFKGFKEGKGKENIVFVNVKVTAEDGAIATIDKVKSTGNVKKRVKSDSNYTGRGY
jgi:hypothetical protein